MILIDLPKAFDTIDDKILLQKLNCIGLLGSAIDWKKSYLTNRITFVEIEGSHSLEKGIKCGVHQGSIIGPLFFYICKWHESGNQLQYFTICWWFMLNCYEKYI